MVRNGYQLEPEIQTGIGLVSVKVPKVRAKDGQGATFRSALVPLYVSKTRSLSAALPWLYLKGISTGEMETVLEVLPRLKARGMNSPKLAVGDGAMGFWAALDEVYSDTLATTLLGPQDDKVLNRVPQSVQPKMKQSLFLQSMPSFTPKRHRQHRQAQQPDQQLPVV